MHLSAVREAAAAGLHILLEKPMATSVAECDEIVELVEAAGVTLMLGFTHRFHDELIRARELIGAGRLGSIGLVHDHFSFGETGPWPAWYYARELSGGGELMHDAVHLVDRMAWLLDSPIVEVHGRTSSFVRGIDGVEDAGVATLAFANGAIGSLFVHEAAYPLHQDDPRVPMPGRLELEIHGTAGSLRYRTWQSLEFDSADEHWQIDDAPRDEMRLEIGEFLAAIREGRSPSVGAAEGRRGIAVVQAIYASERLRRPVLVDGS
jgi:predicted dehydrogenase